NQLFCKHHGRSPAIVVTKHVDAGTAADRIEHTLGFGERVGERLFAEDNLLSFSGGNRDWHMQIARRADVDNVNVLALDDLLPGSRMLQPAIFLGRALDRRFVASTNDLHYRIEWDIEESAHLPP